MKKITITLLLCLTTSVFAQKYVDLHVVTITKEYAVNKMLPAKVVPKRQSILAFEVPGKVKNIKVDIGDRVKKGQLLAEIEDAEALARLNEAQANFLMAKNTFKRSQVLDEASYVSEQRLENEEFRAQIAKAQYEIAATKFQQTKILAPYDGIIQSRHLDEGSIVNPSVPVLEILDSKNVEAKVSLPKSIISEMRLDQKYSFLIGDKTSDARLMRLAPMSSKGSNNRLGIFAFDEFFSPGATARLVLTVKESKPGAWVPLNALSQAEQGLWNVFTLSDDSTTQKDYVELIHIEKAMAYVSGTLKTGDRVIVGGASKVAEGQAVRDSQ
ncbi:efflux RND transporter periplasmic adaptor subunit [Porticoccaceae bacterium]|nr:efflux RND transporter periplasmic adaptor subunit [Porticoccaceae bacterium]MDB4076532.1 efflux RND transporter periplasmic adaptor subunit [Porticoccaceae bacterium]MDB9953377.1 efflux RND transporter periplasmic adaptor subunit [Porticoccaceae bacterium]